VPDDATPRPVPRDVTRRRFVAGTGAGAMGLGIATLPLPRAAAATSVGGGTTPTTFEQVAATSSTAGAQGFSSYNLTHVVAGATVVHVASYDQPGVIGRFDQSTLAVTGSVSLPINLARPLATDGTYLYTVPAFVAGGLVTEIAVVRVRVSDLSVVDDPIALAGFADTSAIVVSGTSLLVIGNADNGSGRIARIDTSSWTLAGTLSLTQEYLEDAAFDGSTMYVTASSGWLLRVALVGGLVAAGNLQATAALQLTPIGQIDASALIVLGGHAYIAERGYGTVEVLKVVLSGGTGDGGMQVVGRIELGIAEKDSRLRATDGTNLFFGCMDPPSTARVVKVRPTGGTAPGSGGLERVGAALLTDAGGQPLTSLGGLAYANQHLYAASGDTVVKVGVGT
jgi:hypothetical protein